MPQSFAPPLSIAQHDAITIKERLILQPTRTSPHHTFSINKRIVVTTSAKDLLSIFSKDRVSFDSVPYSTLMSRLCPRDKAAAKRDPLYSQLIASLPGIVGTVGTQAFANIAHALPKMQEQDAGPVLFLIEKRAAWLVEEGGRQHSLGLRTLGIPAPKLVAAIDANANWLVKEGDPQNVANAVLACANLQHDAPKFLAVIDARADWLVKEGTPQNVANTALAFAKLNTPAPNFWACLEQRGGGICSTKERAGHPWALAIAGDAKERRVLLEVLWSKAMATGGEILRSTT